ncbi:hypothetical protein [Paludibacterium sp.]|uniref:hypothetical protein n=1 Tax=Paludibacterium sp. TaxID=1917523 RepID=UPI0025CD6D84|nr:hypothetical protein [Paludibacterium sp.]MBV8649041.1 hypothetical protein [Paludibacterium sp.]
MNYKNILMAMATVACVAAHADSFPQPHFSEGDTWTYQISEQKGQNLNQYQLQLKVSRTTATSIYLLSTFIDSPRGPQNSIVDIDWARIRDVNGKETVVSRPFSFPLQVGKSWQISFTENNPNPTYKQESWTQHYTATDIETIQVPAGKFSAIKIEGEGDWEAEVNPTHAVTQGAIGLPNSATLATHVQNTQAKTVTGRTYKAFWYAPTVKRWVKSVEEYYDTDGKLSSRYTNELTSFSVN